MVTVGGKNERGEEGLWLTAGWLNWVTFKKKKRPLKHVALSSRHTFKDLCKRDWWRALLRQKHNTTALQRSTEVWSSLSSSNHSYDKISVRGCKFNLNLKNADLWTGKLKWMKTFFTQMCITLKTIMRKQWGSAMSPARDSSHPSANLQRKRKNDDAWWNLA